MKRTPQSPFETDNQLYEIEAMEAKKLEENDEHRYQTKECMLHYQVKWKGLRADQNTWGSQYVRNCATDVCLVILFPPQFFNLQ